MRKYIPGENSHACVSVGKVYKVFGIIFRDDAPWYYILNDGEDYPTPEPYDYFECYDNKIPADWVLLNRQIEEGRIISEVFPEVWASEDRFYERLLDEDDAILEIFQNMKDKMP